MTRHWSGAPPAKNALMRVGVEVGGTFTDLVAVDGGRVVVTKVPSTPRSPGCRRLRGADRFGHRPRAHRGSRPRLDGGDQRGAGAQGRGGRLHRHRGLSRPAVHAAPRPAQHLRPLLCQARAAGAPQGLLRGRRAAARRRLGRDAARRGEGPRRADPGAEGRRLSRRRGLPAQRLRQSRARAAAGRADHRGAARRAGDLQPSGGARVPRVRARLDHAAVGLCPAGDRRLPASLREQAGRRRLHGPLHGDADQRRRLPAAAMRPAPSPRSIPARPPAWSAPRARPRARATRTSSPSTWAAPRPTSAWCRTAPSLASESEIDGLPIRTPVLDIVSVGAGGGSIAWVDDGGMLRVGPQSAGADPGPGLLRQGRHRARHDRRAHRASAPSGPAPSWAAA